MVRERIADDIYVFTSRRYAQVTAGAVLTQEGVILVDTLFYPEETQAVKDFLERRLGLQVRYVINTHYHADHTHGTYLFPGADVVAHAECRRLLDTVGREGLARMQENWPELADVRVVLPNLYFERGFIDVHLGGKTVRVTHTPGHSPDLISALVVDDQILFASDNMMPVPTIFDGSYDDLVGSLQAMLEMKLDSVVRGHGEVLLRGEIETVVESDLAYLATIREAVAQAVANGEPEAALERITIEECGKSRLPLNGFVTDLHQANLRKLYGELTPESALAG
ncbi:MAG: MBL fold metallo-hydrolase [Candidatus Promineifilaceae bacterium]|nr:MBL fold metallo-hydrolase [Candidatus Promineifilaceae bacterium]